MALPTEADPALASRVSPEAILRAVVETSDDAIFPIGPDAGVTGWSPTAERLFGVPAHEVLGRPLAHLFPSHLRAEIRSVSSRARSGERVTHFESEIIRADGLPVPLWVSFCPLDAGSAGPSGVLVVARDVTEQHLAQASLAEVEGRLRDGEALSHVGSWLWDVRTGTVQWSTEFHRIHGVDPFEFEGNLTAHLGAV
ncbi:MAG TPA: PAS domain S-box protein, partial [Acidimicrobiales bacterium]|nr:PAS domain S-box protein [Acidimicrobiales bacterium]